MDWRRVFVASLVVFGLTAVGTGAVEDVAALARRGNAPHQSAAWGAADQAGTDQGTDEPGHALRLSGLVITRVHLPEPQTAESQESDPATPGAPARPSERAVIEWVALSLAPVANELAFTVKEVRTTAVPDQMTTEQAAVRAEQRAAAMNLRLVSAWLGVEESRSIPATEMRAAVTAVMASASGVVANAATGDHVCGDAGIGTRCEAANALLRLRGDANT